MTDAEVQGMASEMEIQRNWALTRGAQLAAALAAAQTRIVELEKTLAEKTAETTPKTSDAGAM